MSQNEHLAFQIGKLTSTVSIGFQGVHRRIDDHRKEMLFHISRLDKKRNGTANGHGRMPYAKIAMVLGLLILGTLGHMAPGAVRSAILDLMKKLLLGQLGAG